MMPTNTFAFECPSNAALNSALSYTGLADAYLNEDVALTAAGNTTAARIKSLEDDHQEKTFNRY